MAETVKQSVYDKLVQEARGIYASAAQGGAPLCGVMTADSYAALWRAYRVSSACDAVIDAFDMEFDTSDSAEG